MQLVALNGSEMWAFVVDKPEDRTRKAREGKTRTVRGTLRGVHHDAHAVNGVHV